MPCPDFSYRRACVLIVLLSACGPGCTSILSTASLRDLVWDGGEHAAEAAETVTDISPDEEVTGDDPPATDDSQAVDTERREAAIDEAVARLAKLGAIGEAARTTLVNTLEHTAPEDWPAVIDAFAESLPPPDAHVVAKADLDAAAESAELAIEPEQPAASPPVPEPQASNEAPTVTVATPVVIEPSDAPSPEASPAEPELTIQNACFATRVQAWGIVDRFAADRFRPGQELIVYFELAGLSAGESPAGHTTCIDSTLRLVAADGTVLQTWSFEPIAETCRARRHDYFARYVVRLPDTVAAGACRVDLGVTDTLSGRIAEATLPLEIVPPLAAR